MTMTDITLVFIGTLATLSTIGMLVDMDETTNIIIPFVSAVLWIIVAFGAFDVVLAETSPPTTGSIVPLVYVGAGFAMMSLAYGIYELVFQPGREVNQSETPF